MSETRLESRVKHMPSPNLTLLHQNAQGLGDKLNLLETVFTNLQVDVLCVSEHWMTNEEELQLYGNIGNLLHLA